jgi:hypothetical protein
MKERTGARFDRIDTCIQSLKREVSEESMELLFHLHQRFFKLYKSFNKKLEQLMEGGLFYDKPRVPDPNILAPQFPSFCGSMWKIWYNLIGVTKCIFKW